MTKLATGPTREELLDAVRRDWRVFLALGKNPHPDAEVTRVANRREEDLHALLTRESEAECDGRTETP